MLSSAQERTVSPKSLLTSVFTIENSGTIEDSYTFKPEIPHGWDVISSLNPLMLSANETKKFPFTVSVPSNALTGFPYQLSVSAVSKTDPNINDSAMVMINILPHARLRIVGPPAGKKGSPGQGISYTFRVMNLGNGKDRFKISASSAHKEKVDLLKEEIELEVGEQGEVVAAIHIPLDVSPETMHVLSVRATSMLLEEGVYDEAFYCYSIIYDLTESAEIKEKLQEMKSLMSNG